MTLVSANLRFVPIFEGVHWRGASNDSGVIENMDFHGFRRYVFSTLIKKWDERYYILLFNPLSPFHWPGNMSPWLTLNGLNVHYTLQYCDLRSCLQ